MIKINDFNKIIVANWKLNGTLDFVRDYFTNLGDIRLKSQVCGVICPPIPYLRDCLSYHQNPLILGAQDCSNFDNGAYTGEVSSKMLKDLNCSFCLVGHSERREIFGQKNEDIRIKAENLVKDGIIPIICVGESLEDKKKGATHEVLRSQITKGLSYKIKNNQAVIAYEPIWAIGTGIVPDLDEINKIHSFLKTEISDFKNFKIIYGGSVKADNASNIMDLESVDGVLVGGASLDYKEFTNILNA
jgi:triosephosphate isomerase